MDKERRNRLHYLHYKDGPFLMALEHQNYGHFHNVK
jgi:hypothetical protein